MRLVFMIVGILCLLVGCIWLLQGINILRGSMMSGQTKWARYGVILLIVGLVLLFASRRRRA